jgi:hypothetical protein
MKIGYILGKYTFSSRQELLELKRSLLKFSQVMGYPPEENLVGGQVSQNERKAR